MNIINIILFKTRLALGRLTALRAEKNLEKKNKKSNFDLEKTLLNEKVAKTPKNDPFLVKSAKKICLGALLTQKRRFSTFSAISRVTAPFHGPTLTLSKNPSGSNWF